MGIHNVNVMLNQWHEKKKMKTTQAARYCLHQSRKRGGQGGPKECRESPYQKMWNRQIV
jgi:hypothetical protein